MDHVDSPLPRRAVSAAMVAAGALIAQQVAGRATRDALFLSTFRVSSLPLVMIAAAVASGAAVLAFSAALARRSPARVLPAALATGTVLLLAEWGLAVVQPRLAAIAVYLHLAVFGATELSGVWSLVVALGAATETLLDFVLNARAAATFARGAALMSFFALFHTAVGWLALAVQMTLARKALRGLGLAGTVAVRPAAVAAAAVLGFV